MSFSTTCFLVLFIALQSFSSPFPTLFSLSLSLYFSFRYNYNTMGNCRRRCAEQSLPKENDALGGRNLRRGEELDLRRLQGGEDRSGLVTLLNTAGVPATGAAVISDGKNDCSASSDDCCDGSGKCCGVTPGCSCPTVSQTYCTVTSCELPGCCGPAYLEMVNRAEPKFVGCPYTRPVCLCGSGDCYPFENACDQYQLCRNNDSVCAGWVPGIE